MITMTILQIFLPKVRHTARRKLDIVARDRRAKPVDSENSGESTAARARLENL